MHPGSLAIVVIGVIPVGPTGTSIIVG
jgi:hypothetical protein